MHLIAVGTNVKKTETRDTSFSSCQNIKAGATGLVERVGAGSPVGHEHGETDSLEDASESADSDGVEGTLLSCNLGDELDDC